MKHLLTIPLIAALIALMLLSSPAMQARGACTRLAYQVGVTTEFEWHGTAETSCWFVIKGRLVPAGLEGE